jgi:hypothetical protein
MSDSADYNSVAFHIKQDAIIAGLQSVGHIRAAKAFDVTVQSGFQPFDLAQRLFPNSFPNDSKSFSAMAPYSIS